MKFQSKKILKLWSDIVSKETSGIAVLFIIIVDDLNDKPIVRHEQIHVWQWLELAVVGAAIAGLLSLVIPSWWLVLIPMLLYGFIYVCNYLWNLTRHDSNDAYMMILFEQEAYYHQIITYHPDAIKERKLFGWIKFI